VKKHVKDDLDQSKSFSGQRLASVRAIQSLVFSFITICYSITETQGLKATDKFPALQGYANCWPIVDLIRLELKYTSGRARLKEQKDDAKAGKLLTKSSQ